MKKFADLGPEYDAGVKFLDDNMVKFPKKGGWWLPAHNFGVNETLLGDLNLWVFTMLPMWPDKRAYLSAGVDPQKEPESVVIEPGWHSHPKHKETFPVSLKIAEQLLQMAKTHPMVGTTADGEFDWIESHFRVKIPPAIKMRYVQEAPKIAVRRWGVDMLRLRPTVIPFDGRKPVPMPSWGRPRFVSGSTVIHRVAGRYLRAKYPPKAMDFNKLPDTEGFWTWGVLEAAKASGMKPPTYFKDIGDVIFWLNMAGSHWEDQHTF